MSLTRERRVLACATESLARQQPPGENICPASGKRASLRDATDRESSSSIDGDKEPRRDVVQERPYQGRGEQSLTEESLSPGVDGD